MHSSTPALTLLVLALGCASAHRGDDTSDGAQASGGVGRAAVFTGDAVAPITWSIPEEQQPPLLDGAAQVLTSVARDRFGPVVGRFLQGSPRVYEGALAVDAGALGAFESTPVTLTSTTFPSLYYRGQSFDSVYVMRLRGSDGALSVRLMQEVSEAELDPEWLSPEGLGSAWIDVPMPGAADGAVWGRCFECMTVLRGLASERIALRADSLDTDGAPPVTARIEGELEHVPAELLTPEILERANLAESIGQGSAPRELPELREMRETSPGVWQREHLDRTYLRCKLGGSRLVDFRTTWTLTEGEPERSGIGPIEVTAAGACESFDYGGGS